jgi:hypothetical protein
MIRRKTMRPAPTLMRVYLALVVVGGIGSHLISEFAGMGAAAAAVTFSRLHVYLGVALIIATAVLARDLHDLIANAANGRDAKRVAEIGLASLPFGGKTSKFWLATAALQFAVAWSTVVAEGSPLLGHDGALGLIGAVIGAALIALLTRALTRSLPTFASAIVEFQPAVTAGTHSRTSATEAPAPAFAASTWCSRLFNRPPPVLQSA